MTRCWLCGKSLVAAGAPTTPEPEAEVVLSGPQARFSFTLMGLMAVMTLMAIGLGVWQLSPGLACLIAFVGGPALAISLIRTRRRQGQGGPVTLLDRIGTFLISAVAILGVLALLCVAAFVALGLWCLHTLG